MENKSKCPVCRIHHSGPTHQDYGVTREIFDEWRSPLFGTANPTDLTNPLWVWQVQSRIHPYCMIREILTGEEIETKWDHPRPIKHTWGIHRYNQTLTNLPDGRMVLIGGWDEDCLYPDFNGYNDVIMIDTSGKVTIYGYPEDCFPNTRQHTATLVGKQIVIIGNNDFTKKSPGKNRFIYALDIESFRIQKIETFGEIPPVISDHQAKRFPDGSAIFITKGNFYRGHDLPEIDNIEDWSLDLNNWTWNRLTYRNWPSWEFRRKDKKSNHLMNFRLESDEFFKIRFKKNDSISDWLYSAQKKTGETQWSIKEEPEFKPNLDLLKNLYHPYHLPFTAVNDESGKIDPFKITLFGTLIRFKEQFDGVRMRVEGHLCETILQGYVEEIAKQLSVLEGTEWEASRIA